LKCPYCNSLSVHRKGFAFNVGGKRQRYKCSSCGRRFSEQDVIDEVFPAVLVFDIETLPLVAYSWGTWDQDIRKEQLIKDWSVLAWSAKWLSDERMITDCLTPKEAVARDDKRICQSIWKLLDGCDVVIVQNGRKFDIPKLNARFWRHGFSQPSSYRVIDTCDAAKRAFGLTYNSLDYIGEYLGAGRKIKTEFQLWVDCDRGDKKALDKMSEYNQRDVELLETVYEKMKSWIPNHPRFSSYSKVAGVCPVCMSKDIKSVGLYQAAVRQYAEFRCGSCGCVYHNTKAEK